MPPLTGVAVKVTEVPEQVGFDPDVIAILTDGVSLGVIPNDIAFDIAVADVTQASDVVITTLISPAVVPASV